MSGEATNRQVGFGESIYDADGNELGTVRGFDEHGFYVSTEDGIAALSSEHLASGPAGEAELMWRCWSCGEMGDIEEIPTECPACGAPKEDIYYWQED
jgi:ABC-type ATPase with predicted acetyltransferase domain